MKGLCPEGSFAPDVRVTSYGAAREVTGSCHLVEAADQRLLVDCGLFQGGTGARQRNTAAFPFDPSSLDAVLLTHAHLDHCGRLPLLVERGFEGPILATSATRELARIVLLDAAKIQEEDARRQSKRNERSGKPPVDPLYDTEDAILALELFDGFGRYEEEIELGDDLAARTLDAGHILGSASIVLEADEPDGTKQVVFSGDIGNEGKPIVRDPTLPPAGVDAVWMESTYGNRNHRSIEESVTELYEVIDETLAAGGNVLIPSFAIERAQDLLYFMREGLDEGFLPEGMEVYLDSPMAISATKVFRRHSECYDDRTGALFEAGEDPFSFPGLSFTRDPRDSMKLNGRDGGAVIIAGSGMCEGGRILHHLKHHAWKEQTSIVFVGFAPRGTRAREIIDGASHTQAAGAHVEVNASVHTINGFSAHAGRDELLAWWRSADPEQTCLVHGEEEVMETLANQMANEDAKARMPEQGETVEL